MGERNRLESKKSGHDEKGHWQRLAKLLILQPIAVGGARGRPEEVHAPTRRSPVASVSSE
jgi:hypothetical protein